MADLNTDFDWATTRLELIEIFDGELPRHDTEAVVVDVFELAPRAVIRAAEQIAEERKSGSGLRSCWAGLKSRLSTGTQPVRDAKVKRTDERAQKLRQAEAMIRNAGHYTPADLHNPDHSSELDDDLFGDRGLLRQWHDDAALRERMQKLWRELQPLPEPDPLPISQTRDDWVTDDHDDALSDPTDTMLT